MGEIENLIKYPDDNIAGYNRNAINEICKILNMEYHILMLSSTLSTTRFATKRLFELPKHVNANVYLCGGGASGYQEDILFEKNNTQLSCQNFVPEPYLQFNTEVFVPGLYFIDVLMNIGWASTISMINKW